MSAGEYGVLRTLKNYWHIQLTTISDSINRNGFSGPSAQSRTESNSTPLFGPCVSETTWNKFLDACVGGRSPHPLHPGSSRAGGRHQIRRLISPPENAMAEQTSDCECSGAGCSESGRVSSPRLQSPPHRRRRCESGCGFVMIAVLSIACSKGSEEAAQFRGLKAENAALRQRLGGKDAYQ